MVITTLVEQPLLNWAGRGAYLTAVAEKRRTELYAMDLVYLLVKAKYDMSGKPMPSECEGPKRPKDTRNTEDIKKALLKKLGSA